MLPNQNQRKIAYFSMEIALESTIPTYSGGLGVLAGDTLRAAADLSVPMVAVTLLDRKGYFRQSIDSAGNQSEQAETWNPADHFELLPRRSSIVLEGRAIHIAIWSYPVRGLLGSIVPVYLLDTLLDENDPRDRDLTDYLYGGDQRYRLRQEALLGLGGLEALDAVGHSEIDIYHMNEGHSSLLTLGLLKRQLQDRNATTVNDADIQAVRAHCIFTTHTPVPAGHDQFDCELVNKVLGEADLELLNACTGLDGRINMTYIALRFSHYVNGVAMHHGEVSRGMFPTYPVHAITNGVHALTWTSQSFQELYDRHVPEWRRDNRYLRYAIGIAPQEIMEAHKSSKRALIEQVRTRTGVSLDDKTFTIGFARRATQYKRPDLLLTNLDRLKWIATNVGPLQVLYGGKAHPADNGGKEAIRKIYEAAAALRGTIPVVYVENYDMDWAKLLTSGADVWLNTPRRPQEASGTSGMKAALNGVPSLSILDGWWIEGCIEGVTGWAIGSEELPIDDDKDEIMSLYSKLETIILPMYYGHPKRYGEVMRSAITFNGSFFNTERMVEQYISNAYFDDRSQIVASA